MARLLFVFLMRFLLTLCFSIATPSSLWASTCKSFLQTGYNEVFVDQNKVIAIDSSSLAESIILNMILEAKNHIRIETRSIKAHRIVDALAAAVKRGVDVEILTTMRNKKRMGRDTKRTSELSFFSLESAGVKTYDFPVKRINRNSPYLGVEHHRKSVIVDFDKAYIGSSNIRFDGSFESGVYISGDFVKTLNSELEVLLHRFNNVVPIQGLKTEKTHPNLKSFGTRFRRLGIGDEIHSMISRANESITIASTNFQDLDIIDHLIRVKKEKPHLRIRVLLSSHHKRLIVGGQRVRIRDHILAHFRFMGTGIEVSEYSGPDISHAKLIAIDGKEVLVGSYDLTPRSLYGNLENAVGVKNGTIARHFEQAVLTHFNSGNRDVFFNNKEVLLYQGVLMGSRIMSKVKKFKNYSLNRLHAYSRRAYLKIFIRKKAGSLYNLFTSDDGPLSLPIYNLKKTAALRKLEEEFRIDGEAPLIKEAPVSSCTNCIYLFGGYTKAIAEQVYLGAPFLSEKGAWGKGAYMGSHPRTAKDYSNAHASGPVRTNVVVFEVSQDLIYDASLDVQGHYQDFLKSKNSDFSEYARKRGYDVVRYRNIEGPGYDYYVALETGLLHPIYLVQTQP